MHMAEQVDTRGLVDGNVEVYSDGSSKMKHGWTWIVLTVLAFGVAGLGAAIHVMPLIGAGLVALGLCLIVFRQAFAEPSGLFRNYENPIEWSDKPNRRRGIVVALGAIVLVLGALAFVASLA
jgi:hypothetical protein